MRIIPAIDIIDGKCVRLTQGDYNQKKVYNENPLDVAKEFEAAGLKYLHLVDLDGAKRGTVVNSHVVQAICNHTSLQVDFGGGVKKADDIKQLLEYGVKQVNLGSIAVKEPEKVLEWLAVFGADKIILSADVRNEQIAINGWQENAAINIIDFIDPYTQKNLEYVVCTDISTDGMLSGPNLSLYKKIQTSFPGLKVIASGGVSGISDVIALKQMDVDGVIIGKAIYEGKVTLDEIAGIEKRKLPNLN